MTVGAIKTAETFDELYPGRFLKAGLLKEKPVTLTIAKVHLETLPDDKTGGEKDRGIISFTQTPKQLVLNRTNGECLKAMFGKAVQAWVGKRVTFVPEKDRFGAELVDAIRIQGSPDIEGTIDVEIRMPKKRPKIRKLTKTVKGKAAAAEPTAAPEAALPAAEVAVPDADDGTREDFE